MTALYTAPSGRAFSDPAELEHEYILHPAYADGEYYAGLYAEESRRARAELTGEHGVSYGDSEEEYLEVFPGAPGGPLVLFLHGGYWRSFASTDFDFVARGLVPRGATVVVPNYALCPRVSVEEILRQLAAAVRWAHRAAPRYGADPGRLILVGHSAGGHAAARLSTIRADDEGGPRIVQAGCALSGIFDLRPLRHTSLQSDLRLGEEEAERGSPVISVPESAPPLLVTYGGRQSGELIRQSEDFIAAWSGPRRPVTPWVRSDLSHFSEILALADPDSELVSRILALEQR